MITVDLAWAMASFLILCICLVIGRWIFYNCSEELTPGESKHLQHCPYCAYIFFDYEESSFRVCPRCESYITASDSQEPTQKGAIDMNANGHQKLDNESGVVLVTVVVMTLAMMILAVAIMSANVNQTVNNEHQIERIKAEQLAKGAFWVNIGALSTPAVGVPTAAPAENLDGKTFTTSVTPGPAGAGPGGTTEYTVQVSYPKTF